MHVCACLSLFRSRELKVCYNSHRQDIFNENNVSNDSSPFKAPSFGLQIRPLYSRVHKSYLPVNSILSHIECTDYLIFISLLPFQPRYGPPAGIFHFGVPNMRAKCSTPPILLHITVQPISGADYKLRTSLHARDSCSSPYYFLLCSNILLNTLYSNTL